MDARDDGVKKDPAAPPPTFEPGDGHLPVVQAGVDLGGGGEGSADLGGGDRFIRSAAGVLDHSFTSTPGAVGGVGGLGSPPNHQQLERGMAHVGGADSQSQAPVSALRRRRAAPHGRHGPDQGPPPPLGAVVAPRGMAVSFHFQFVGGGRAAMRWAAFLAMFAAANSLIGEVDAPRASQFRALMVWLGGYIMLYLSRRH
ncbi:unnamed protein product [Urochloa decumbens]|uniref:Uncharacterized protein n=1 Tax=Urochloa decumbens TaxID=240449 RepID=A0ABC9CKI3_9POAL